MQKIKLFVKRAKIFIADNPKKNSLKICYEFLKLLVIKKEFPSYYFGKFLYKKEATNYKDYLSGKEISRIVLRGVFNKFDYYSILTNKICFALYCVKNDIPVPHVYSYNLKSRFFFNNQISYIKTEKMLVDFYSKIFKDSGIDSLFIKPISGQGGGKGCF